MEVVGIFIIFNAEYIQYSKISFPYVTRPCNALNFNRNSSHPCMISTTNVTESHLSNYHKVPVTEFVDQEKGHHVFHVRHPQEI